jgi:hypothetical protein
MSNPAMPNLVKVGFSLKDPALRAQELEGTGTPHPFKVEYEALVNGPREVEQAVHTLLADRHERKEWFRCSPECAVDAIKNTIRERIIIEQFYYTDKDTSIDVGHVRVDNTSSVRQNVAREKLSLVQVKPMSGYCAKGNRVNLGIPCHECTRFECRNMAD